MPIRRLHMGFRCTFHPDYDGLSGPIGDCSTCSLLHLLANGNEGLEEAFSGIEANAQAPQKLSCPRHSYQATRRPGWNCQTCWLLYVLTYQYESDAEDRLGSLNPYAYLIGDIDLRQVAGELELV